MPDSRILAGVIGRAHGVRGRVRVTSHTADPADLTSYGPLTDEHGQRFLLRWRSEGVAEVGTLVDGAPVWANSRAAAEKLTNTRLYIERSALPAPDDDEFYLADLVGLAAENASGELLGKVAIVHDYGAGASLEIEAEGRAAILVPFTYAAVPTVDIAGGRVVVVVPSDLMVPGVEVTLDQLPASVVETINASGPNQGGADQVGTDQDRTDQARIGPDVPSADVPAPDVPASGMIGKPEAPA